MQGMIFLVMLTARGDGVDRIIGLEQGADDTWPSVPSRELSARIEAVLRRRVRSCWDAVGRRW